MSPASTIPWRAILTVVTMALAGAWAVLGWLLLTDYRPGSGSLAVSYQVVGVLLLVCGLAFVVVDRRRLDVVPIAGLGVVAGVAALMTLHLVLWDSLVLATVATGDSVRGVWWPVANADLVDVVVVDGRQVEPDAFRAAVYAQVVAGAAVLMTIPLAAWLGLRAAPEPSDD